MTYERLPYEDPATTPEMISDCAAVGRALHLPTGYGGPAAPPADRPGREAVVVPDSLAERVREMQLPLC